MGFAYKVARITLNGTMFGGSEHWSTGFYMGATGADATAPTDAFLTEVNTAWKAFFQNSTSYISTSYQTTGVRGALLGTDGKTIAGSIKNFYPATPYAGGSNNSALPPQCALVATLMTDTPPGVSPARDACSYRASRLSSMAPATSAPSTASPSRTT